MVLEDIKDCYPGIESDCSAFIIGGDVIATKNKELKSIVLYPRGDAFYTKLSGIVTACPGKSSIQTSVSLLDEIRR